MMPSVHFVALMLLAQGPGVSTAESLPLPIPAYRRPANRVSGKIDLRVLILRTAFENDPDPKVSRHPEANLKAVGESLNEYFKIQSYGLMSIKTFEISPVVTIGKSNLYEAVTSEGVQVPKAKRRIPIRDGIPAAEKQLNRDLTQEFDMICMLMNASPSKGKFSASAGAVSAGPQHSTYFVAKPVWRLLAHEIGHNFGFGHAWSVRDVQGEQPLSTNRTFTEYGDPVSPMGNGSNSYLLSEKYRMGWIGDRETDPRFIKRFNDGEFSFMAYDRPDAEGCVGGFMTGNFGVELRELVTSKDDPEEAASGVTRAEPGPQRIWFSVISRGNFADGEMPDLKSPVLFAHLSSLVPPGRGNASAPTTVIVDLKPKPTDRARKPMEGYGLTVGDSSTIALKSGRKLRISFLKYDSATHIATVSAVRE